ncbi:MAG TPA: DMT family transporter [Burkholderiales bacterium]|nr:DMT family transporter [Burkholderiales bacterium]
MSPTFKGVLAAAGGILFLTLNDAVSKYLTQSFPVGQVICLRQAATLLFIVPYVALVTGFGALRVVSWRGQLTRGMLFVGGSAFMVWGLATLPLATVITIMFVSPAFIAALSAPMLAERVGLHRWIAIASGFVGVMIVMRPGGASFEWALLIPVAGAFTNAFRDIMTRRLARTETSVAILFWSAVIVTVANATTAPVWVPVPVSAAAWFIFVGLLNTGAHFLLIEAFRMAEAALVAPVRYTGLVWAVVLGYAVWGELPDAWVLLGAAVIVASGVYMIRMESRPRTALEQPAA